MCLSKVLYYNNIDADDDCLIQQRLLNLISFRFRHDPLHTAYTMQRKPSVVYTWRIHVLRLPSYLFSAVNSRGAVGVV